MSAAAESRPVPLLVLGDSRRRQLLERLTRIVAEWHAAWASEGVPVPHVALPVAAAAHPKSIARQSLALAAFVDEELLLYAQTDTDFVKTLCVAGVRGRMSASFGSPREGMESALTEEALRALSSSLLHAALPAAVCAVRTADSSVLEVAGAAWTRRVVRATVAPAGTDGGPVLEIDVTPGLVDALLGGRPATLRQEPLTSRRRAADGERVSLTVTLGSASVSWGDLSALAVGDALVLDQDLAAPCALTMSGSGVIADAHLGRLEQSLAVQIARIHTQERRERR